MKALVDLQSCASSGLCEMTLPEVFQQDDIDGRSHAVRDPRPDEEAQAKEAADMCPARAIKLMRGETSDRGDSNDDTRP